MTPIIILIALLLAGLALAWYRASKKPHPILEDKQTTPVKLRRSRKKPADIVTMTKRHDRRIRRKKS